MSAGAAPLRRSCSALIFAALLAAVAGAQPADDWIIETVAGDGRLYRDDVPATATRVNHPSGVALDGAGNLYIADTDYNRIRKVDAAGVITTVAGGGTRGYRGYGGDGGPAVEAQLNQPTDVALDGAGNLYIADWGNSRIRKVDAAGVITTVAGDGTYGYGGDGGPATEAQLRAPRGVALDGAGNLYIADWGSNRIRKVEFAGGIGVIFTVAGDGTRGVGGYFGDGGPATTARLYQPSGVALDGAGNLYIADTWHHRIRKVDAAGVITTVAGDGTQGYFGDGGPAVAARLYQPYGMAPDGAGNLYIADRGNHRIRKVDAAGMISTVAGGGLGGDGGAAVAAQLNRPTDVALDAAGNLYIADAGNRRIRKVDAAGVITTVAGDGRRGSDGDGGPAVEAQLSSPYGVALDAAGNLYFSDSGYRPSDVSHRPRIRKVDAAGVITTVAGDGTAGFSGDGGAAAAARLSFPYGVALDAAGNLYIADRGNSRIRMVDTAGVITTVAGDGTRGFGGDGGPAVEARLFSPYGVALDAAGNLYIADTWNHRIRKVDAAGVITTVAGDGMRGSDGDGGPATAARLGFPTGVALDAAGNLYIADQNDNSIRKVDSGTGVITTVAGDGSTFGFYGGDGGPAVEAYLNSPQGVALDAAGNLYIADSDNHRIRRVTLTPAPTTPPPPAAMPSISAGGVVLASGTPLVNRISPNAIISVFGQDFAPQGTLATAPTLNPAGRVAANLAATCLEIDGERVPLFYVAPTQINVQVPHYLTPRTARLNVIRGCGTANEQRSAAASATVAAVSPAFFNFVSNPDGRNPVVALHGDGPDLAGPPGAVAGAVLTPAEPGEVVTLFGTGFGPTKPPLATGEIPGAAANLANAVSFSVGGIAVAAQDVFYAGAAPCCAGLYQFAVRLPDNLPDGNAPVTAAVQGVSTPSGPFLAIRRQQ